MLVISTQAQPTLQWEMTHPGIWKAIAGKPEKINLLSAAEIHPNVQALAKLPTTKFPLEQSAIKLTTIDHKIYLRFPLEKEEQLFGL